MRVAPNKWGCSSKLFRTADMENIHFRRQRRVLIHLKVKYVSNYNKTESEWEVV